MVMLFSMPMPMSMSMVMLLTIRYLYFYQVHSDLKFADKWKLSTISFESHVFQRASFYSRKVGTRMKRCARRVRAAVQARRGVSVPLVATDSDDLDEAKTSRFDGKLSRGCVECVFASSCRPAGMFLLICACLCLSVCLSVSQSVYLVL